MSARQINNIYQYPGTGTTKEDKINTVLAFINELQVKESSGSHDELNNP
jgi:hypothetical protein